MTAIIDRWFKSAGIRSVDNSGFEIVLDGKPIRAKSGFPAIAPSLQLAQAVADEWNSQDEKIDFGVMPMTRLSFLSAETQYDARDQIEIEIAAYGETDLICFRAEQPQTLKELQTEKLEPICRWTEDKLQISLIRSTGIMPQAQSKETVSACRKILSEFDVYTLTAVNQMTRRAGSIFLALAVHYGRLSADAAWTLSRLEEDWQIAQWGPDAEAMQAAEHARAEFSAAARFLDLLA